MISSQLRAPAMGEMRLLTTDEIIERAEEGARRLGHRLGQLGMGCFEDARGYYWLGVLDPHFPEHNRWFHVLEQRDVELEKSWERAIVQDVDYGVPRVVDGDDDEISETDPTYFLDQMQSILERVIAQLGPDTAGNDPVGDRHQDLIRHGLQVWQTLGYSNVTPKMLQLDWGQGMHDLICHYDTWQAAHPEAAELPQLLALRMHGLGDYADQVVGIKKMPTWLAGQHCNL